MRRCQRCKRLFCRDCMVPDVATGDPTAMLCLHCARRVVSPRVRSKYDGLTSHLKFRGAFTRVVKLSFARIDGLIGSNLPIGAYRDETWWSNSDSSAHARAWLDAGWEVLCFSKKFAKYLSKNPKALIAGLISLLSLFPFAHQSAKHRLRRRCRSFTRGLRMLSGSGLQGTVTLEGLSLNLSMRRNFSSLTKNHNKP